MAIKHVNKKRIELTRQVLLDLKHVSSVILVITLQFLLLYIHIINARNVTIVLDVNTKTASPSKRWFISLKTLNDYVSYEKMNRLFNPVNVASFNCRVHLLDGQIFFALIFHDGSLDYISDWMWSPNWFPLNWICKNEPCYRIGWPRFCSVPGGWK